MTTVAYGSFRKFHSRRCRVYWEIGSSQNLDRFVVCGGSVVACGYFLWLDLASPTVLEQVAVPFAGVLPFGAVLVELVFVMTALWEQQLYFIFGFLLSVMIILTVTCAEISIVMCYFQLCAEDYRW